MSHRLSRREVLRAAPGLLAVALAGCGAASGAPAPPSSAPASTAASPAASTASKPGTAASTSAAASSSAQGVVNFSGGDPQGFRIRIGAAAPSMGDLPHYAALSQGFFAEQHLAVSMVQMTSSVMLAALSKGDIEFVESAGTPVEAATRGFPFKTVLSAWKSAVWTIVGKQELKSVADLKGHTMAASAPGSTTYLYVQAAFKNAGLAMSDANVVGTTGTADSYTLLLAGKVDAASLSPPYIADAEERGFHVVAFIGDTLKLPYSGLGTNTSFIAEHRPQVVGAVKAMMDATRWAKANPDKAADLLVKYVGASPSVARRSVDDYLNLLSDTGEAAPEGIQQMLDIQAQQTGAPAKLTPEQVVDYGPLHEALGSKP
jgi:ABC-type nitrate/sulfonate/bicarbonate transport system substrate-binding protein